MRCAAMAARVVAGHAVGAESTIGQRRGASSREGRITAPLVVPTLKSGPSEALRLSAVPCWAHASGVGKADGRGALALPQPSLRRARMPLEPLGKREPDGVLNERPRRHAVGDPQPGP